MSQVATEKSELEKKKQVLHSMIDAICAADYVEANTRFVDVAGKTQTIHQILIEKNGNVIVGPKRYSNDFNEDDSD